MSAWWCNACSVVQASWGALEPVTPMISRWRGIGCPPEVGARRRRRIRTSGYVAIHILYRCRSIRRRQPLLPPNQRITHPHHRAAHHRANRSTHRPVGAPRCPHPLGRRGRSPFPLHAVNARPTSPAGSPRCRWRLLSWRSMAFHLHRAERTDLLADGLGGLLSDPLADPLAEELVIVPAKGVERWLSQRLSHILGRGDGADGVCAGIAFRNPHSLIAEITGTVDDDPWAPDALVWPLLEVIDQCLGESWCNTPAIHLGHFSRGEEKELRQGRRQGG